jgi:hypothetical protein
MSVQVSLMAIVFVNIVIVIYQTHSLVSGVQ